MDNPVAGCSTQYTFEAAASAINDNSDNNEGDTTDNNITNNRNCNSSKDNDNEEENSNDENNSNDESNNNDENDSNDEDHNEKDRSYEDDTSNDEGHNENDNSREEDGDNDGVIQISDSEDIGPTAGSSPETDIGYHVQNESLDDDTILTLLERHWKPPENYKYPYCYIYRSIRKGHKRIEASKFKPYLKKLDWLVLSDKDKGFYCKYCALFNKKTHPTFLVNRPLKDFEKPSVVVSKHKKEQTHKDAENSKILFLKSQISSDREQKDREVVMPIIKTIIFCGQQNFTLQGLPKSDSAVKGVEDLIDDKIFKALLQFRIDSDKKFNINKNPSYVKNYTKRTIIDLCKEEIQETILNRAKQAKYFSLIFVETTDALDTEQLSVSIRYLHDNIVKEDFLSFLDAYTKNKKEDPYQEDQQIGSALANAVETLSKKLNLGDCVGICMDICSATASKVKRAVKEILKSTPHAKAYLRKQHVLNRTLAKTSKVMSCRNAFKTMRNVIKFAKSSKLEIFKDVDIIDYEYGHYEYLAFQGDALVTVCKELDIIAKGDDSKSASEAYCFLHALRSTEFIIASTCINDVLTSTLALSKYQHFNLIDELKTTTADLRRKCENVVENFHGLFVQALNLARSLDCNRPIICTLRNNNDLHASIEEYFRNTVYIPLLEGVIDDLKRRFSNMNLFESNIFIPKSDFTEEDRLHLLNIAEFYSHFLEAPASDIIAEYESLISHWQQLKDNTPGTPIWIPALQRCKEEQHPNIKVLLKILATHPTVPEDQSFTTLNLLEDWVKSTTSANRLTGLAHLFIHPEVTPDAEIIMTRFIETKRRFAIKL